MFQHFVSHEICHLAGVNVTLKEKKVLKGREGELGLVNDRLNIRQLDFITEMTPNRW